MFLDTHRMVFTFLSWLDLLRGVLAVWISILKIFKSLQGYRYHKLRNLESSSGHTLNFLSKFVEISFQEYVSEGLSTN